MCVVSWYLNLLYVKNSVRNRPVLLSTGPVLELRLCSNVWQSEYIAPSKATSTIKRTGTSALHGAPNIHSAMHLSKVALRAEGASPRSMTVRGQIVRDLCTP